MTAGSFDLSFVLSAEDRLRARAVVDGSALKREDHTWYYLSWPALSFAVVVIKMTIGLAFLVWLAPWHIIAGDPQNLLHPKALLCLAVVAYCVWLVGHGIADLAAGRWRLRQRNSAGREGVHWGPQRMMADADGLFVELPMLKSVYRWTAIAEMRRTRDLLLLMLSPRKMIVIPRRAFDGEAEEQSFCDFVEDRIRRAA